MSNYNTTGFCLLCVAMFCAFFFSSCTSSPAVENSDFLGNYSPIVLDTLQLTSLKEGKPRLSSLETSFVFYPRTNTVDLNFRFDMNAVTLTFTEAARKTLLNVMQTYIEQYQADMLKEENNEKRAFWGKQKIPLQWGTISPVYYTVVDLRFEYQLVSPTKPYLVLGSAMFQETERTGILVRGGPSSPILRIALSPLNCKEIMDLINQDALLTIVSKLDAEMNKFDLGDDTTKTEETDGVNELF